MPNQHSKNQAEHNRDICYLLNNSEEYANDWIITTAFYSALHFLDYYLYPYENFNSFQENYRFLKNQPNNNISQHQCRLNIISVRAKNLSSFFKLLYDASRNARYYDYKIDDKSTKNALNALKQIESLCNK